MRDSMTATEFKAILASDEKIAGGKSNGRFLILDAKRFASAEEKILGETPAPAALASATPALLVSPPALRLAPALRILAPLPPRARLACACCLARLLATPVRRAVAYAFLVGAAVGAILYALGSSP